MKIRIATRKSKLALWQAEFVKSSLKQLYPTFKIELVKITSKGDQILDKPLAKIGGKGLFVKELENALLEKKADLAIHSMKDVPMSLPDGLCLQTICKRENPLDAFVSNRYDYIEQLPLNATIGTSSLRRQCQLLKLRPDLKIKFLRGNVDTRIKKLEEGGFDAIILAAAGLIRLNMSNKIKSLLTAKQMLPSAGQGAIGIEIRSDNTELSQILKPLHHKKTAYRVHAERAINKRLGGGCHVPIACYSEYKNGCLLIRALVGDPTGSIIVYSERVCNNDTSILAAKEIADELLKNGAKTILDSLSI